jgi:cAMP-dependent protein kinase regulator
MGCAQSTQPKRKLVIPEKYISEVIAKIPVFKNLKEDELDHLACYFTLKTLESNEKLFGIGDSDRTFYIIAEGQCTISVKNGDQEHAIATQGAPSHFGEICLVQDDSIRSANVFAAEKGATLLSLTYADWNLLKGLQWHSFAIRRLKVIARHRLSSYLKNMHFLQNVDDTALNLLGGIFHLKHVDVDEVILKEGDQPKGFYVLADGEVSVTTDSYAKVVTISSTSDDNFFGELALIEKIPVSATVKATKDTLLLHVSPTAFQNFLQIVTPEVRHEIANTIRVRAKAMLSDTVSDLVDPKNVALGENLK